MYTDRNWENKTVEHQTQLQLVARG